MPRTADHAAAEESAGRPDRREALRRGIMADTERWRRISSRGLWSLALFLLISLLAWRNFPFLPRLETLVRHLGTPPSAQMVNTIFIVYTFFAILLSLSRMTAGVAHLGSFSHVGYLAGFYFFYYAAGALDDNYWAVFAAGMTILAVECYRIRAYCLEVMARNRERLAHLERTGQLPPDG